MKFGLALPHYDFSLPPKSSIDWPLVRDWAQRAEQLGFDSLWVSDHLFFDLSRYGGEATSRFAMECFTTLAAISQWTTRIRMGTLVACNDLRHPSLLAKMASTLSVFSNGRFELGIGAGWYEPEYRAAGVPFEPAGSRIERLGEAVELIRGMLSNPSFSYEGRFYRVEHAWTLPQPPPVPVIIGGKGKRLIQTAAKYADGFNTVWAWTPDDFAGRVRLLESAAAGAGRDPAGIKKTVGLFCLPGEDDAQLEMRWQRYVAANPSRIAEDGLARWRADKLVGTPSQMASRINDFKASGAEEVILCFGLVPFQVCDASAVEDFARDVIPLMKPTR